MKIPDDFVLIFKAVCGSRLYGTNTSESDYDIRGVFIPSTDYIFGLKKVEQLEDNKNGNDNVCYEIRKFVKLAADCNPNIIELLFINPDNVNCLKFTDIWSEIYNNSHLFVSKKARWTFYGYVNSQLKRIEHHRNWLLNPPTKKPVRSDFGLPDKELISSGQIKCFNLILSEYLKKILNPFKNQIEELEKYYDMPKVVQNIDDKYLHAISTVIDASDNFIEAVYKEKAYNSALKYWNQYINWQKNRNPIRAELEKKYGYDCKHASNLVRLVYEAEELLMNGYITFPRPEADLLVDIRNGLWSYNELIDFSEKIYEKFNILYEKSPLPHKPNFEKINKMLLSILFNKIK